ncbi:GCN5-like N-acetyltransferase [Achlya hypogyna]|uniref:GCN5-like N-acetyltransferase n=1 Tax=Achlya hypogyna TaxID=1202772 RepID=A0A1V9YGI8_ACHHY|nr:GCN5-like N-acetyltransferase [Achlya hypogyna]
MIELRALRPAEVDAWLDHCAEVFEGKATREYFAAHLHSDPRALESWGNIVVAVDAASRKIVSTVRVVPRQQYFNRGIVPMSGLAEVSTKETYRRQGLAAQLIDMAIQGPMSGSAISFLHTNFDRLGHHYTKHGYISMPHTKVLVHPVPVELDVATYQLRSLDLDRDCDALLRVYAAFASRFDGPLVRDRAYVTHWIRARHELKLVVATGIWAGTDLVGYVFAAPELVEEIGVDPALAKRDQTLVANALLKTAPPSMLPTPVAAALQLNVDAATQTCDKGGMYRPMAPSTLLRSDAEIVFWNTDDF